jgi:hypothetical protein
MWSGLGGRERRNGKARMRTVRLPVAYCPENVSYIVRRFILTPRAPASPYFFVPRRLEEEHATIKKEYLNLRASKIASDYTQQDGEHSLHQGKSGEREEVRDTERKEGEGHNA